MKAYPDKTLVLMDLDCIVSDSVSPVANIRGDVGITIIARNVPGRLDRRWRVGADRRWRHYLAVEASSRVVVFGPTPGAQQFAEAWRDQVATSHVNHDEHSQIWAFLNSPGVRFDFIPVKYSGREVGQIEGAVIAHDSAHNKLKIKSQRGLSGFLKALERRFFRTGRTRALRRQLQTQVGETVLRGSP
jgi:hypothetical protein